MILFLDFDGVLHPEPCCQDGDLFCRRPLFEAVMRDFPAVKIVISSTWRQTRSMDQLKALFSEDIAARVVGATPNWMDLPELMSVIGQYPRHVEVEGWLRQAGRPCEKWVAIDDRADWFKPFLPNLVRCDSNVGLNEEVAITLRRKLRAAG